MIKEGTQTSGLFDSRSGGLITKWETQEDKHIGRVETVVYFVWEMQCLSLCTASRWLACCGRS